MNVAEKLARQIRRVAELRHHYLDIGQAGAVALALIDAALERACKAAGSDDAGAVIAAGLELEGFES
ncbi:hypothetical protein [uncultured Reyranella sp.]|jgi:hypothetical protein|uniref:hypothetical protein n=1 Tax=uncultured Reyranella sp. TaxID=735512 RepID=UPI00259CA59D|nr:hypothetical protein [uncultured Reyranella sp.]